MFGNWETGKRAMDTAPTITVRIAITMATIGRLIKKFDTVVSSVARPRRLARRFQFYMHAGRDLLNPVDDHTLTRIQPIANHPQGPNLVANVNRFDAHDLVTVHSGHLIAALQLGNSLLWNKQGTRKCFNGNTHLAVLSGAQNVARIRE